MKNSKVPESLIEYYYKLQEITNESEDPKCPICKKQMKFITFEFFFTNEEIQSVRKFKCLNCVEKNIILWRK